MHFDYTFTIGNIFTCVLLAIAAIKFWAAQIAYQRDMDWRVTNLEAWRKEHMVDADARDQIITRMDKILYHVTRGKEGTK